MTLTRTLVLAVLLVLGAFTPGVSQVRGVWVAAGHQTLTVAATSVGLTVPATANTAMVQVLGQPIRYTFDTTAPVAATTGFLGSAGDLIVIYGRPNVLAFRMIRDTGSSATVQAEFSVVRF